MKLNTVLTIVIFSLHGFALADSILGDSVPKVHPAPPPAKGGHGPETLPEYTTKIETVHPTETKSADLPKKSETSPLPKTKTPDLPKKSETPNLPKTKTLDSPKLEIPHTPKVPEPTRQEDAHPTKSAHTTESKKSDPAKSPSPHPKVSDKPKPLGFTTRRRVTTSSTNHAAIHSQPSKVLSGALVRFHSCYILFHS
jgi:hypothetical protein